MKRTRQRGFTMVSAIFLVVVLAALGAFIVVVSTSQQIGSAMDVQGARAYQAARAGIEWGTYQVWNLNLAGRNNGVCPADTTFAFPATAATLAGFSVTVTCVATVDPGGHGGPTVYSITAIACNIPAGAPATCPGTASSSGYVERRISVAI